MTEFIYECPQCGAKIVRTRNDHYTTNKFCSGKCKAEFQRKPIEYYMFRWLSKNISHQENLKSIRYGARHAQRIKFIRKETVMPKEIEYGSCCEILKSHHNSLKDDNERLSTEFIKKMSKCGCDKV